MAQHLCGPLIEDSRDGHHTTGSRLFAGIWLHKAAPPSEAASLLCLTSVLAPEGENKDFQS